MNFIKLVSAQICLAQDAFVLYTFVTSQNIMQSILSLAGPQHDFVTCQPVSFPLLVFSPCWTWLAESHTRNHTKLRCQFWSFSRLRCSQTSPPWCTAQPTVIRSQGWFSPCFKIHTSQSDKR